MIKNQAFTQELMNTPRKSLRVKSQKTDNDLEPTRLQPKVNSVTKPPLSITIHSNRVKEYLKIVTALLKDNSTKALRTTVKKDNQNELKWVQNSTEISQNNRKSLVRNNSQNYSNITNGQNLSLSQKVKTNLHNKTVNSLD